jgi:hypothetical protein
MSRRTPAPNLGQRLSNIRDNRKERAIAAQANLRIMGRRRWFATIAIFPHITSARATACGTNL